MERRNVKRHEVEQLDGCRLIPLTQGQNAIVDADLYDWLSQWNWTAQWADGTSSFYATREVDGVKVQMHRLILGIVGTPCSGDHRNGDTLDNRRSNLRSATRAQNNMNQRVRKDSTTGFRGVTFMDGRFYAYISTGGKRKHLGGYSTKEEAARAYNEAAKLMHGEFARLNEIHTDFAA